ncbi:MAG: NADH-quinone oxidoreductase subunit C [Planctomycetes bacterium]|nr:NADH-quinone oxidoreductase subunit C [Planctomycetota bacterium]
MNGACFDRLAALHNGQAVSRDRVPELPFLDLRTAILEGVELGGRLAAFFGRKTASGGAVELVAVLALDAEGQLYVGRATPEGASFPALTPECTQAHLFEREIAEQFGLAPEGHPWLKPVRYPPAGEGRSMPSIGVADFYRVAGEEPHEVAVGPVHAGVIEPGHFRFQCHGENVFHLEIMLGYQHRGVERALVGGPTKRTLHYMETLAGDTSIGHALAHCMLVEAMSGTRVPARAHALRGVALELERLANHVGDLGALAADVGFLPTAAYCGRLRGDYLNATALLCGSRFGRGMVRPGGVGFDLDPARAETLVARLDAALRDTRTAVELLWNSPSVQARFEETGTVSREVALELGLVGPAARACGVERDVRQTFPSGIYQFTQLPVATADSGDVFARAQVRWLEIERSVEFIREQVQALPAGACRAQAGAPAAGRFGVSLVEGWRGEICHVATTDASGRFSDYKVVDPSFHNWTGLAMALRGQQISDFPLCNKSFNLSYCGHDL